MRRVILPAFVILVVVALALARWPLRSAETTDSPQTDQTSTLGGATAGQEPVGADVKAAAAHVPTTPDQKPTTATRINGVAQATAVTAAVADDPLAQLDPVLLDNLRKSHRAQGPDFDDTLREFLRKNPQALEMYTRGQEAGQAMQEHYRPPELPPAVAPAPAGIHQVSWDQYDSTISIGTPGPDGRSRARVETYDRDGNLLVSYAAAAYRDAEGNTQIDARGSAVEGPWADHWSPDSFRIGPDSRVQTVDDLHRGHPGNADPSAGG